ncbi:hypothetical protein [Streptomyces aureoverticillatus]|uniref:hypothetical protein n=1 Tax=Streptomyces aureoverticillatus TaxID=66871 RepID=UPI0013DAAE5A|nr:hypothetical protein [Streptomyces aureoverticillatus]QIB49564.1 hypothetical protein G3H79_41100 [Streptomyces aureoverticillatus]
MSTHNLMFLLLTVITLAAVSAVAGIIGYGIARAGGAPVTDAISRGSIVFFSTMTLFIALLGVLLPAVM